MMMTRGLIELYRATIDRSKFREVASRVVVFLLPVFFIGRPLYWGGIAFVLLGVALRAWAAGCLYKDEVVAQSGPYLMVRHPLYLGSCLLALGLIVTLHHWFVTLVLGGVTALTYWHTIRHEESNLRKRFGGSYLEFSKNTPQIFPSFRSFGVALFSGDRGKPFSWNQYLKNREYECLLGVLVVLVILAAGTWILV